MSLHGFTDCKNSPFLLKRSENYSKYGGSKWLGHNEGISANMTFVVDEEGRAGFTILPALLRKVFALSKAVEINRMKQLRSLIEFAINNRSGRIPCPGTLYVSEFGSNSARKYSSTPRQFVRPCERSSTHSSLVCSPESSPWQAFKEVTPNSCPLEAWSLFLRKRL